MATHGTRSPFQIRNMQNRGLGRGRCSADLPRRRTAQQFRHAGTNIEVCGWSDGVLGRKRRKICVEPAIEPRAQEGASWNPWLVNKLDVTQMLAASQRAGFC